MRVVCKGEKRKYVRNIYYESKRMRVVPIIVKRKTYTVLSNSNEKKQKRCVYCLIHEEKYICDIYECSGVKHNKHVLYMPYTN
jgi:hypothetical protein